MSRIGKRTIEIPKGVTVTLDGQTRLNRGAVLFTAARTTHHDASRYHITFSPE